MAWTRILEIVWCAVSFSIVLSSREDPCMSNDTDGCERSCRHRGTKFGSCTGGACSCSNVPSIARTGESDDPCRRKDKMECSIKCHNVDYVSGHCLGRVCHCMKHDSLYPGPTLSELGPRQVAGAPTKREAAPQRLPSNDQTARGAPKRSLVVEQFHEDKGPKSAPRKDPCSSKSDATKCRLVCTQLLAFPEGACKEGRCKCTASFYPFSKP